VKSLHIWNDTGRKATILEGDSVRYYEKNSHLNMCLILDGYRGTAVRISLLQFCLWGWMKSEVYTRNVDTRDELLFRILVATARIKTREDQLKRTTRDFASEL
jgi:hypothetical protein